MGITTQDGELLSDFAIAGEDRTNGSGQRHKSKTIKSLSGLMKYQAQNMCDMPGQDNPINPGNKKKD